MPIAVTTTEKSPGGTTVLPHGSFWRAEGSESTTVSETSLGFIDTTDLRELVLLVSVTAITGASATLTIKVYQVDQKGARYPDAGIVSRAITAVSETRDTIAAPLGGIVELTKTFTGTTPTVTAAVEAQLKS